MSILGELQSFNQDQWVELFELDATNIGAEVYRFHSGVNELSQNITWQGNEYQALPVSASGFEYDGTKFPRPKMQLANIQGLFSTLVRSYNDLIGCKITRKRTKVRFLDSANFPSPNPDANPSEHLEDEVYYVTQKTNENKYLIEFELGSSLDLQGVYLPRRQVIATRCCWRYRGEECGFAGGAIADNNDKPTTDLALDRCGKRIASCKLRFGANGNLPFGGFPGAALVDVS